MTDGTPTNQTNLVPRATIQAIVLHRDRALFDYARAYELLDSTGRAFSRAHERRRMAAPGEINRYNHHQHARGGAEIKFGVEVPDKVKFLAEARRAVDTDVWAHVIKITDLERLMDKEAKDQLHQQLLGDDVPEVTVENVEATLRQFAADAGIIFRRGIANAFSKLDRRFRSHDGWRIGSRVILSGMFDEWGGFNYHRNHRDTLRDIERAFLVLDDAKPVSYGGIVDELEKVHGRLSGRRQAECETKYLKVRCWKNGNAHIWFKRDDLLARVNQLLGEYYGAPIPEERAAEHDPLADKKTSLARNHGFFPTPAKVAEFVVARAMLNYRGADDSPLRVLEPSAGDGALAAPARDAGCAVDCVEVHPGRAAVLRQRGFKVLCCDFLVMRPANTGQLFDRVVMNPPFDRERDIDHVTHALEFLKPSGLLVAVMSAGTEFRETKKAAAFRELVTRMSAQWTDLPERSFVSSGTNCNTVLFRVFKDGRKIYGY